LIESNSVKNIVIFGDEVVVDVEISNPTIQAKKKVEVEIMKAIHDKINQKISVKVNVKAKAVAPPIKSMQSLSKKIPGVKNIIAIASGKGGVGKSTITAKQSLLLGWDLK